MQAKAKCAMKRPAGHGTSKPVASQKKPSAKLKTTTSSKKCPSSTASSAKKGNSSKKKKTSKKIKMTPKDVYSRAYHGAVRPLLAQ